MLFENKKINVKNRIGFNSINFKNNISVDIENKSVNQDYEEIDYSQDVEETILDEKKEVKNEIVDLDKEEKMYNSLLDSLKDANDDVNDKIHNMELLEGAFNAEMMQFVPKSFEEVTGYESEDKFYDELNKLKSDKAMYETFIYQLEQKLKSLPYEKIKATDSYKEFAEDYKMLNEGAAFEVLEKDKSYQYMNLEQRKMFDYLFEKEGIDSAQEYLDSIQDSINQAKGAEQASRFLDSLDINDKGELEDNLANLFGVSNKGLNDGILTFFDGIKNSIVNDKLISPGEYEKMLILEYLQEKSNILDETYEFSSALGNMLPAITTSILVSTLATPAAGAITASALMGTSAFGNAKHQALTEGNDLLSSTIYGALIGASEMSLGYFLGKIPGISETSGLTLKNLLCEGTEEFSQEWIDAGLQAVVLGKDVKWEEIPTQAGESFVMGFLMAGLLNGGQEAINVSINGQNHELNVEKILELLNERKDLSLSQAVNFVDPTIAQLMNLEESDINNDTVKPIAPTNELEIDQFIPKDGTKYFKDIMPLQSIFKTEDGKKYLIKGNEYGNKATGAIKHMVDEVERETGFYNSQDLLELMELAKKYDPSIAEIEAYKSLLRSAKSNKTINFKKISNLTEFLRTAIDQELGTGTFDERLKAIKNNTLDVKAKEKLLKQANLYDKYSYILDYEGVLTNEQLLEVKKATTEAVKILYAKAIEQFDKGKFYQNGDIVDISDHKLVGVPVVVNASLDPSQPYLVEIISRLSNDELVTDTDYTIFHMLHRSENQFYNITVNKAIMNQVKRACENIISNNKDNNLVNLSPEEVIQQLTLNVKKDITEETGSLYIQDSEYSDIAVEYIDEITNNEEFKDIAIKTINGGDIKNFKKWLKSYKE